MSKRIDRRRLLQTSLGLGVASLLPACPDVDPSTDDDDAGIDDDDTPTPEPGWAAGGTGSMVNPDGYPDPFTDPVPKCLVLEATTAGPCTTEDPPDRRDISEGYRGLPMRLMLRVVDRDCEPIVGAVVTVWHTDRAGIYSGDTPAPDFCSYSDPDALAANWSRGKQTADARGVVTFDTVYPGWYPRRAIHIHLDVTTAAGSTDVSQVFFPEDLTEAIFAEHPDYTEYGQPDTVFATDGVVDDIGLANMDRHVVTVARMKDGAMLASATIAVMG